MVPKAVQVWFLLSWAYVCSDLWTGGQSTLTLSCSCGCSPHLKESAKMHFDSSFHCFLRCFIHFGSTKQTKPRTFVFFPLRRLRIVLLWLPDFHWKYTFEYNSLADFHVVAAPTLHVVKKSRIRGRFLSHGGVKFMHWRLLRVATLLTASVRIWSGINDWQLSRVTGTFRPHVVFCRDFMTPASVFSSWGHYALGSSIAAALVHWSFKVRRIPKLPLNVGTSTDFRGISRAQRRIFFSFDTPLKAALSHIHL
jgi:hypothetical protein